MSDYQIQSKRRDIQRLKEQNAGYQKSIADNRTRIIRCNDAISRTKNASTVSSKIKEIGRYEKQIADLEKKRADNLKKEATYSKQLTDLETRQEKERQRTFDQALRSLEQQKEINQSKLLHSLAIEESGTKAWDVFISHASEDKEEIADALATALSERDIKVWYDKFSLTWGDSLMKKINEGIANSNFGILILSHNFFSKEWTQKEMEALFDKEMMGGKVILPLWHNISKNDVAKYSPLIAGKLALKTSDLTIEEICDKLEEQLKNS